MELYRDAKRTLIARDDGLYTISPVAGSPKTFSAFGQPQPLNKAPRQVETAVKKQGLVGYVWFCGLAMPRAVADAITSHRDERDRRWAVGHPGAAERRAIDGLFAEAERRLKADDDSNTMDYYSLRAAARAQLKAWKLKYPREAAEERADDLRAKAIHQRDLAVGALVYDCDGSLIREDQNRRAAEFRAKANELDSQVDKIEEE